jgi:RNA polymerase sigma factor (sigma-70 family)
MKRAMTDAELLDQHVRGTSATAFTELVRRHLPLVYRAALRQTGGNVVEAQEIAQEVFTNLARKAPSLTTHPVLAAWFHTSVHHIVSARRRSEKRRRAREEEAQRMEQQQRKDVSALQPGDEWDAIRPRIDELLELLNSRDREAVLLRFVENQPFAEIAQRLSLTEDAARMRVNRALARLRELFDRQGVRSTEAAVAAFLFGEAALGAPAGLAESVASGALAGTTGTASVMATQTLQFMTAKNVVLTGAALLLAGAAVVQTSRLSRDRDQILELRYQNHRLHDQVLAVARLANNSVPAASSLPPRSPVATISSSAGTPTERPAKAQQELARCWADLQQSVKTPVPGGHPLRNLGLATPIEAMETFAWAGQHYDAATFAKMIYFDPAARVAADALWASVPSEVQSQYPTPEALFGLLFAYDSIDYPGPQSEDAATGVPAPQYIAPDQVRLQSGLVFRETSDGWKMQVPVGVVTTFGANAVKTFGRAKLGDSSTAR